MHLDASYGRELDKKGRQLGRKGKVEFSCATEPAQLRETFEALKIFRRDRFEYNGGGELLQVPAYFDFYLSIAEASDLARTYRLSIDGRVIAGAMGLMHRGAFLVVLVGFTQTEFKNQSVGSLMLQELVRDCIARGDTALDFTIGDEPYKVTFGAQKQAMWQMQRAGSPLGFAAGAVVDKVPAVKALARQLFQRRRDKAVPVGRSEPAEA
jgi:CelD/BcsL family acetyltransferase involved in cellulose biosynthesis